jgi:hypothetical protein
MATLEFDKTDETCGNVYLIDENLCLSNSYQIINKNFATLSASLVNLDIQTLRQIVRNGLHQSTTGKLFLRVG